MNVLIVCFGYAVCFACAEVPKAMLRTKLRCGSMALTVFALPLCVAAQSAQRPIVVRRPPATSPLEVVPGSAAVTPVPAQVTPAAISAPSDGSPVVVRRSPSTPTATSYGPPPPLASNQEAVPSIAPPPAQASSALQGMLDGQAIRALLEQQTKDWNRGDLDAFAQGYKHAPDILFISGSSLRRGYDGMLQRYKESYATRERMGTLGFSELEIQPLGTQFATVTGRFHLERTKAGGSNADGSFLLVLEKTSEGWKIVRDDTTAQPAPIR